MISLDKEESDERFEEMDKDGSSGVTWKEYIAEGFGDIDENQVCFFFLDFSEMVKGLLV